MTCRRGKMYEIENDTILNEFTLLMRNTFSKTEIPNVYKDFTVQNLALPCIVVKQTSLTDYRQMQIVNHHSLRYIIDIRFHPDTKKQNREQWGREKAYKALQVLQKDLKVFNQKIHFTSTEITTVDEVTHLIVIFSFFVRMTPDDYPDMETLKQHNKLRR